MDLLNAFVQEFVFVQNNYGNAAFPSPSLSGGCVCVFVCV